MKVFILLVFILTAMDSRLLKGNLEKKVLQELLLMKLRDEIHGETEGETEEHLQGSSIQEQLFEQESKYMKYFKEQNYTALSNLYTDDAWYCVPGEEAVYGKDDISTKVWIPEKGGTPNADILTFKSEHVIDTGGDYAIGHGEWYTEHNTEVTGKSGRKVDGHYLTVYRKVGGEWLIEVDIVNIRKVYPQSDEVAINEAGESKRRMVDMLLRLLNDKTLTPGVLYRRGLNKSGK